MSGSDERLVTESVCGECGTRRIQYDPPMEFDASAACGQLKPGNYSASAATPVPVCDAPIGHDGDHYALLEYVTHWPAALRGES